MKVRGERVLCIGNLCVDEAALSDVAANPDPPDDVVSARKAQELTRIVTLFRQTVCPGRTD